MSADSVARKILKAVVAKRSRAIIPWQAWLLLLGDAVSARLGDLLVRWLKNSVFMTLIGMYRGRVYQFDNDQRNDESFDKQSNRVQQAK